MNENLKIISLVLKFIILTIVEKDQHFRNLRSFFNEKCFWCTFIKRRDNSSGAYLCRMEITQKQYIEIEFLKL